MERAFLLLILLAAASPVPALESSKFGGPHHFGTPDVSAVPLNTGDTATDPSRHQWLALVYAEAQGTTDLYVCGGALIAPRCDAGSAPPLFPGFSARVTEAGSGDVSPRGHVSRWVVTAAHCVFPGEYGKPASRVTVRLHQFFQTTSEGVRVPGPQYYASQVYAHPNYVPLELIRSRGGTPHKDDVALIKLPRAATVVPLEFAWSLANWKQLDPATIGLTQRGYGKSLEGGAGKVLREIKVKRVSKSSYGRCGGWAADQVLEDICAGGRVESGTVVETCGGDSGSPLFVDRDDLALYPDAGHLEGRSAELAYGVVSRGSAECGVQRYAVFPAIFTAVVDHGGFVATLAENPGDGRPWPEATFDRAALTDLLNQEGSGFGSIRGDEGTGDPPSRSATAGLTISTVYLAFTLFHV